MHDAVYTLGKLLQTSFYGAGFVYLFCWIAAHKPTNLEAVYIFVGVLGFMLIINFTDSTNSLLVISLLSLLPSFRQKPKFPSS